MALNISVGQDALVKAKFRDSQNRIVEPCFDVTWSSSDATTCSVAASNNSFRAHYDHATVKGLKGGSVTITATSRNLSGSTITATVTVNVLNPDGVASMEIDTD